MNKAPAFQFYPQDFISSLDVQLMTTKEVGAYILLLANSWIQEDQCFLPDDENILMRIARMTKEEWDGSAIAVLKKFKKKNGKIYNTRLLKELEKQEKYQKTKSESGKSGAKKRWTREKNDDSKAIAKNSSAIVLPMANDSSSSSSSSSTSISKIIPKGIKAEPKNEYGNKKINLMLLGLKNRIGIDDFRDTQKWSRKYGRHLCCLIQKLGTMEFVRRLDIILDDSFKKQNCNSIKFVYNELKGFIEPEAKIQSFT